MSEHYFTTPQGPERRRRITARIWSRDYEFATANGVFSGDGLDLGTAVLLRECEPPEGAVRVLDLGCGWGPIACAIADHAPYARVDAVDVNERALELCGVNAEELGVADRVRTLAPDQVEPDATYDQIWSNPPVRIGKEALHELLTSWLARLAPRGVAYVVIGKHLGADSLQRWLVAQAYRCDRLASAKGFRVFAVTLPDLSSG